MDHVKLVKKEACNLVSVEVDLLAFRVFEAEGNVGLEHHVAINIAITFVEDAFDRGLVPYAVVIAAVKLVAWL